MLTDSRPNTQAEPVEEIYDLIRERNAQLNNSIAIYTYGLVYECEKQFVSRDLDITCTCMTDIALHLIAF